MKGGEHLPFAPASLSLAPSEVIEKYPDVPHLRPGEQDQHRLIRPPLLRSFALRCAEADVPLCMVQDHAPFIPILQHPDPVLSLPGEQYVDCAADPRLQPARFLSHEHLRGSIPTTEGIVSSLGYSPNVLEWVFSEVRLAPVPLEDHPPNHRCYHARRSGLANPQKSPQKSPQASLSDASTATITITKTSMMIMLPTITSQRPGTEMRLMAL
jgi:hypothetical protein